MVIVKAFFYLSSFTLMTFQKHDFLLLLLVIMVSACNPMPISPSPTALPVSPTATPESVSGPALPTGPTALWVGWLNGPDTPNPSLAQWAEAYTVFNLVYSTLFRLQPDGSYSPDLVESVVVSEDDRIWTFTIRNGAFFHDGIPLTAEDVAFSLNLYGFFGEIKALDLHTVEIRLEDPIPNMEGHLINYFILPQHIWARYENAPNTFDNLEMIGSGPFQMVIYQQDSFVHLKAVTDHYLSPPKIEDVIFIVYEDELLLAEALQNGEVDMITTLPYAEIEMLQQNPQIEVAAGEPFYATMEEVVINQITPENCPPPEEGGICSGHPALRDLNVRRALSHATDKITLVEQVTSGYASLGVSILPTKLGAFHNSELQDYTYDPELARELLDANGYLDTNNDGVREMPDDPSQALQFRLNFDDSNLYYRQLAEHLTEMWQEIGISLNVEPMDVETLTAKCCPAFDYDIMLWAWQINPEPGLFFDLFDTREIPTGYNESGYSNPNYDILNAIQHTEVDVEKRREVLWQMQDLLLKDVATIVLFYPQTIQAYRVDRFTGWLTEGSFLALEDVSSITQIEPVP
ncbi:MAG: ABC transporter substrate-binding protein [Anaerolineales bacterium]